MSLTITLPPETEQLLRETAARNGQSAEEYARNIIKQAVGARNGNQEARPVAATLLPSDEALAGFRKEVQESGITDEELFTLVEEVREEVYREKHGRPSKTS